MVLFKKHSTVFHLSLKESQKSLEMLKIIKNYKDNNSNKLTKGRLLLHMKKDNKNFSNSVFWFLAYLGYISISRKFFMSDVGMVRSSYTIKLTKNKELSIANLEQKINKYIENKEAGTDESISKRMDGTGSEN